MRCFLKIKSGLAVLLLLAMPALQAAPQQWPASPTTMEQATDAIRYILTGSNGSWVDGERLALPDLAALCDSLDVTPADLIATKAEAIDLRKNGTTGGLSAVGSAATIRPRRAQIRPGPE